MIKEKCHYCDKLYQLWATGKIPVLPIGCWKCVFLPETNKELLEAKVNEYGDIVCPTCTANILTQPKMKLEPKIGKCSRCSKKFRITQEVADLGNKLADGNKEIET